MRSYGPLVGHAGDEDEPDPADVACGRWCIARGSCPSFGGLAGEGFSPAPIVESPANRNGSCQIDVSRPS